VALLKSLTYAIEKKMHLGWPMKDRSREDQICELICYYSGAALHVTLGMKKSCERQRQ